MKTEKIVIIVFVLSFLSMLVSQLITVSPATFKILDTVAVSGFVGLCAVGTVACAGALNDADFGSNPFYRVTLKALANFSGILAGAMSLGFVVMEIIAHVESISRFSFEQYAWALAIILGTIFLGLSRKILKNIAVAHTRTC